MIGKGVYSDMHSYFSYQSGNSLFPFLWLLMLEEDVQIATKSLLVFIILFVIFKCMC